MSSSIALTVALLTHTAVIGNFDTAEKCEAQRITIVSQGYETADGTTIFFAPSAITCGDRPTGWEAQSVPETSERAEAILNMPTMPLDYKAPKIAASKDDKPAHKKIPRIPSAPSL